MIVQTVERLPLLGLDDIGMGECPVGEGSLLTTGASTCIILAAHNKLTRRGLLGHFSTLQTDMRWDNLAEFEAAITAVPNLGDPEDTALWLGGGKSWYESPIDSVEVDRVYASQRLQQYIGQHGLNPSVLTINWSTQDIGGIDVQLDFPTGVLSIEKY